MSSRRSSFLPQAASFLHGVCDRYSTFQPLHKLTRQGTMQTSARPVFPRSWARLSPSAQPVYPLSLLLEDAQYLLKRSSLPSSRLRRLPLCQLCRKGRSQRAPSPLH